MPSLTSRLPLAFRLLSPPTRTLSMALRSRLKSVAPTLANLADVEASLVVGLHAVVEELAGGFLGVASTLVDVAALPAAVEAVLPLPRKPEKWNTKALRLP